MRNEEQRHAERGFCPAVWTEKVDCNLDYVNLDILVRNPECDTEEVERVAHASTIWGLSFTVSVSKAVLIENDRSRC